VWCSVLQCVAARCSVLPCNAVWCSVIQSVELCCSIRSLRRVLQCVAVCCSVCVSQCVSVWYSVLNCVVLLDRCVVCYSVLQCACCSKLQCVTVWGCVLLYIQFLTKFYFFGICVNVVVICSHVSGALYHGTGRQWGHSETAKGRWSVYIDVVVCAYVYMYIRTRKYVYTHIHILQLLRADDQFTSTLWYSYIYTCIYAQVKM